MLKQENFQGITKQRLVEIVVDFINKMEQSGSNNKVIDDHAIANSSSESKKSKEFQDIIKKEILKQIPQVEDYLKKEMAMLKKYYPSIIYNQFFEKNFMEFTVLIDPYFLFTGNDFNNCLSEIKLEFETIFPNFKLTFNSNAYL